MIRKMKLFYFLALSVLLACTDAPSKLMVPAQLTCEYLVNPAVVDIQQPRLAWINKAVAEERAQEQTAWEIRVASSVEQLENADLWESGKVSSSQSTRVLYEGKALSSELECWWQVRVWDKQGNPTNWSKPAFWRMGLLNENDWKAQWIGAPWEGEEQFERPNYPGQPFNDFGPAAPMLRKEFNVDKKIKKAVAFVTGLGYFEFYVNGEKAGNDVLVPNITNYSKRPKLDQMMIKVPDNFEEYRVMYLAYDVTKQLRPGRNCIGSILGNGFYNPRMFWCEGYGTTRFLAQLHITYEDGSDELITSNESWKVFKSPILKNMVYYGETYDARLEQPGWSSPEFDDSKWMNAAPKKAPYGHLVAHTSPTDRVMETLQPKSIKKLDNGNYFVDFGKEISGWIRLNKVEAPAGHSVEIAFNSNLYSGDNTYIFKGNGPENYAPRFNWFVFSGVEIKNWFGELKPENIRAEAVNTNVPVSAEFETSNVLFNKINAAWIRSQEDNMHGGIASDCPHRERNGYTGDGQVACVTVLHNFDAKAFYQKWISDMRGAQNPETGYVPNGAPWQPGCGGGVAWGAAICIMPWEFYLHTGSLDMLADNYEAMKGYIRYMKQWVDDDGIMYSQALGSNGKVLKWLNLGEWVAPDEQVPDNLVHTFYFWRCAQLTAKSARALGNKEEAEEYEALAEQTRKAFHERFYSDVKGSYGNGGGNIFALKMGVPSWQYPKVIAAIRQNLKAHNGHLDTGIFGTQFFFEVLSENGLHKEAYEALNKRTEPGFGRWIELGSTTTREHWDESGSFNHPMFGGGLSWFYRQLAGMQADEKQPGFKHILFKPQPVGDLSYVKYYQNTSLGRTGIEWKKQNDKLFVQVEVPVGSTATLYIPNGKTQSLSEENNFDQVKPVKKGTDYIEVNMKSGSYKFVAE